MYSLFGLFCRAYIYYGIFKKDQGKKLNTNEFYTIHKIHSEKNKKDRNKIIKNFEMKGSGIGFLAKEKVMKKLFDTEFFSFDNNNGKKSIVYQY